MVERAGVSGGFESMRMKRNDECESDMVKIERKLVLNKKNIFFKKKER